MAALAAEIRRWQGSLTKFNSVAHFKPWIEAVNPIAESQTFRLKIEPPPGGGDVVLRLVTRDAGDGRSRRLRRLGTAAVRVSRSP